MRERDYLILAVNDTHTLSESRHVWLLVPEQLHSQQLAVNPRTDTRSVIEIQYIITHPISSLNDYPLYPKSATLSKKYDAM